jgi:glycine/D-amino acid oxidase-like deaminating enzyme
MKRLPETESSYWRESYSGFAYPELREDLAVDVVIVGGGITGLTSAYLLKQSGFSVAVLEKDTIGAGTTGHTTGKVSSQHGLVYNELTKRLGERTSRVYGQANQAALEKIAALVKKEHIDCDWQYEDSYVYTTDQRKITQFKTEAKTAAGLGLPASFETTTSLPFAIQAAVRFSGQATFNVQKYVAGLARLVAGDGCYVFEHTRAAGIRDGEPGKVKTKGGTVTAKHIIVTTNVPTLPLVARGSYCFLEYPHTSYIVAGYVDTKWNGMYISPDKGHYSILPVTDGAKQLLLIGGKNHITGTKGPAIARHQELADYAAKHFGMKSVTYRWKARDYMAYDDVPLVGKVYPWSKRLYTATAFRKWGLTNSMVAATILHDMIIGKKNPWSDTFNSLRVRPIASIPRVVIKTILS